jgi:hypothetical protein
VSGADCAALVTAAHQQLDAPLILVWDNLNIHISAVMRTLPQPHHAWLTVVRLPARAPDLNPAEGAWSNRRTAWQPGLCGLYLV